MKNSYLTFPFSSDKYITAFLSCYLSDIQLFDKTKIIFTDKNKEYLLAPIYNVTAELILSFCDLLHKCVNNKLKTHKSIDQDIGYMFNQWQQKQGDFVNVEDEEGNKYWVGLDYLVWKSPEYVTWIYNKNKSIVFQITPCYKWLSKRKKRGDDFVSYDEFIKNYNPIFTTTIKKSVAVKWVNKLSAVRRLIEITEKNKKG